MDITPGRAPDLGGAPAEKGGPPRTRIHVIDRAGRNEIEMFRTVPGLMDAVRQVF